MNKTALITGITGQDGAFLTELLLTKGYSVHGIKRRSSFNTERIDHLYHDSHVKGLPLTLHYGDMTDTSCLTRIIQEVQPDKIYNLVADREFIGDTWMTYLNNHRIPYDIRLRKNLKVWYRGKLIHVFKLFRRVPFGQTRTIQTSVILGNTELYLQGCRIINSKTNKPEFLIIATYCDPSESTMRYAERWYIENMFKDMKSIGFQLECTHVTKLDRLDTLIGILAIAYTWMIKIGIWVRKIKPERFAKKKHGRPAKSIFRGGLDEFINALFSMDTIRVRRYVKFLSCT